jgi:hypothetical protein
MIEEVVEVPSLAAKHKLSFDLGVSKVRYGTLGSVKVHDAHLSCHWLLSGLTVGKSRQQDCLPQSVVVHSIVLYLAHEELYKGFAFQFQ